MAAREAAIKNGTFLKQATQEEIDESWWRAKVGKDFPISSKCFETIVHIFAVCMVAYAVYSIYRMFVDYFKEKQEEREKAEREEEREKEMKLERLRLRRMRAENRKPRVADEE